MKGEQCEQSNQKNSFLRVWFQSGELITGMSHTGRMPEVKNQRFTLHPLFTTYHTESKRENRKVNSVNSSFEKNFFPVRYSINQSKNELSFHINLQPLVYN